MEMEITAHKVKYLKFDAKTFAKKNSAIHCYFLLGIMYNKN